MNTQAFEARLRAQAYPEVATVIRDAIYALGEHSHPFDACALITQGSIAITVAGLTRHFGVGQVFELAANTLHSEAAGADGVTYLAGRRPAAP